MVEAASPSSAIESSSASTCSDLRSETRLSPISGATLLYRMPL